jgi:hypothetical protein
MNNKLSREIRFEYEFHSERSENAAAIGCQFVCFAPDAVKGASLFAVAAESCDNCRVREGDFFIHKTTTTPLRMLFLAKRRRVAVVTKGNNKLALFLGHAAGSNRATERVENDKNRLRQSVCEFVAFWSR